MCRDTGSTRAFARRASVALAAVLLAAALAPAGAAEERPTLGEARDRLETLQEQIASEQAAVASLQERIVEISSELGTQRSAYEETQARLVQARASLGSAEVDYAALRERLEERAVQALYLNSGPAMELLLGSDSFSDVSDRLEFLNQLQVADAALADQVAATARSLQERRDELQATLDHRASVLSTLDARQQELLTVFADQQAHLEAMGTARREAEALVAKMKEKVALHIGGEMAPYGQWAAMFLQVLGAPDCRDNMVILVAWQAAEGTQASYNPLATTLGMPGSTDFNSVGVQNYVSLKQGVEAIHETLLRGAEIFGYGAILDSLAACAPAMTTAEAINASSWCRGCASGAYVTGIVPSVEAYFEQYAERTG